MSMYLRVSKESTIMTMTPSISGIVRRIKHRFLANQQHDSLITIEISRHALLYNLNQFRHHVPQAFIAPVLKSNAYGHGLLHIAHILKTEHVPFFVVDSYFEVRTLRDGDIDTPLLVIGYTSIDSIVHNDYKNIRFTITSLDALRELGERARSKTLIHIKIDTGMNRQGLQVQELEEVHRILSQNHHIHLEGICSHFADADNKDTTFTEQQIQVWNTLVRTFRERYPLLTYWHISNSAGHAYPHAEANLTRLGIGLYGITEIPNLVLKPALRMMTIVSSVKEIRKGDRVGYNGTFIADRDMKIATIPVGYYEGIDRRLSNKGFVKIDSVFCPIVGKVSMNITTIDVSECPHVQRGDKVIVVSDIPEDKNSIVSRAYDCGVIPYEIAVHIPNHLKRVVV